MSGIDPSTRLTALTPDQKTYLCEWVASRFGGYSRTISCGSGFSLWSESFATCQSGGGMLANASCAETVGVVESCIDGVVAQQPCTSPPSSCIDLLLNCGVTM